METRGGLRPRARSNLPVFGKNLNTVERGLICPQGHPVFVFRGLRQYQPKYQSTAGNGLRPCFGMQSQQNAIFLKCLT
eukprot:3940267-Rhodomonas_salina.5